MDFVLSLEEGHITHECLRSRDLFKYESMETLRVVLSQHKVSIAFYLIVGVLVSSLAIGILDTSVILALVLRHQS